MKSNGPRHQHKEGMGTSSWNKIQWIRERLGWEKSLTSLSISDSLEQLSYLSLHYGCSFTIIQIIFSSSSCWKEWDLCLPLSHVLSLPCGDTASACMVGWSAELRDSQQPDKRREVYFQLDPFPDLAVWALFAGTQEEGGEGRVSLRSGLQPILDGLQPRVKLCP